MKEIKSYEYIRVISGHMTRFVYYVKLPAWLGVGRNYAMKTIAKIDLKIDYIELFNN